MGNLYEIVGKERLKVLVDRFYDIVFKDSSIAHLFDSEKTLIREKQYLFLTQFLGGPPLYSERYGHPKLKARHLPHKIGEAEKDEWLRCMKLAIDSMHFEDDIALELYNCFPKVANHMRNC